MTTRNDEMDPPEFTLTDGEREHLTMLRRPEADFLPLIGARECIDGATLHPKAALRRSRQNTAVFGWFCAFAPPAGIQGEMACESS